MGAESAFGLGSFTAAKRLGLGAKRHFGQSTEN